MPELPEVETIKRQLSPLLVGQRVLAIEVRESKNYQGEKLIGKKIVNLVRVGKYLYVVMSDGSEWEIHLKMTGRLIWNRDEYELAKHTRIVIELEKGKLYYWDTRKFGYIKTTKGERVRLGKDPWEMSEKELLGKLKKTKRAIKDVILDQRILAGVGNIYANDGLWEAGIDPRRVASSLSGREVKKILAGIRLVMKRGLIMGGASDNSYVNALGEKGSYQNEFRVYKRTNQPCCRCGTKLKRIVVGGRGTWVCEKCQV